MPEEPNQPSTAPPSTNEPAEPTVSKEEYDRLSTEFQTLRTAVAQYAQAEVAKMNQPQTPAPVQPALDPDTVLTDPKAFVEHFQGQTQKQIQDALNQMGGPVLNSLTALARDSASRDPKLGEVFDRWGTDIDNMAAQYPQGNKHDVRFWHQLARQVKADHVDELVEERAAKKIATIPRVETGQSSTGEFLSTEETSDMGKIRETDWGKSFFNDHDGAARKITDMCDKRGITLAQYFEEVKDAPKRERNPHNRGEWTTQVV